MEINSQIRGLVEDFARTLGMEGLAFDSDGFIELRIGTDLHVSLGVTPRQEALVLAAEVRPDADRIPPRLLRRILITNSRLASRKAPSFAIVPNVRALLLQQRIPIADLDYPQFETLWLDFLETHGKAVSALAALMPDQEQKSESDATVGPKLQDELGGFLRV